MANLLKPAAPVIASGLVAGVTKVAGVCVDAGAAATVELRDGAVGAQVMAIVRLTAAGSMIVTFGGDRVNFPSGVYVNFAAGTGTVIVYEG